MKEIINNQIIIASVVIEIPGPGTAHFLAHSPSLIVHYKERKKGRRRVEERRVKQREGNFSYLDIHKPQKFKFTNYVIIYIH